MIFQHLCIDPLFLSLRDFFPIFRSSNLLRRTGTQESKKSGVCQHQKLTIQAAPLALQAILSSSGGKVSRRSEAKTDGKGAYNTPSFESWTSAVQTFHNRSVTIKLTLNICYIWVYTLFLSILTGHY